MQSKNELLLMSKGNISRINTILHKLANQKISLKSKEVTQKIDTQEQLAVQEQSRKLSQMATYLFQKYGYQPDNHQEEVNQVLAANHLEGVEALQQKLTRQGYPHLDAQQLLHALVFAVSTSETNRQSDPELAQFTQQLRQISQALKLTTFSNNTDQDFLVNTPDKIAAAKFAYDETNPLAEIDLENIGNLQKAYL